MTGSSLASKPDNVDMTKTGNSNSLIYIFTAENNFYSLGLQNLSSRQSKRLKPTSVKTVHAFSCLVASLATSVIYIILNYKQNNLLFSYVKFCDIIKYLSLIHI